MALVESWDESKPAGSRDTSLGDDDIREFKRGIRERLGVDHKAYSDESGHSDVGYHKQSTLVDLAGNPTLVTTAGIVFAKTVSGKVELCYMDSSGNVIQLTSGGLINDTVNAKSGDWMMSSVTTGRAGWTDVSATYSNKFMRINATPLSTGGSDTHTHDPGTYVHSHTHSVPRDGWTASAQGDVAGRLYAGPGGSLNHTQANTDNTSGAASASAITGASASASNVPAYVTTTIFQKN